MTIGCFAHSGNGLARNERWETIQEHIRAVSDTATVFASAFHQENQATAAGILHDLGKYSEQFQRRLKERGVPGRDHWSLGAMAALRLSQTFGHFVALAIQAHHVGLDQLKSPRTLIESLNKLVTETPERLTTADGRGAMALLKADGFALPKLAGGFQLRHDYVGDMLDVRMLFSSLVDADFLETEAHFEGDATTPRRPRKAGPELNADAAIAALDRYVQRFSGADQSEFLSVRQQLMKQCVDGAKRHRHGCFTLTAPTGAGKTLAMLAFALHHARVNNLRRVILVMPFLNIIDQAAKIYRDVFPASAFGEDYILESHSEAIRQEDSPSYEADAVAWTKNRQRLLSENWDAPIVLTTNVQMLESLFARRTSSCRKLHRLAGSVILFDEIQSLPAKLTVPTLAAMHRLTASESPYRTTVVFSTATQPAFEALSDRFSTLCDPNEYRGPELTWRPVELVSNQEALFDIASRRVNVNWEDASPIDIDSLSQRLSQQQQVLCIVNLKRHAVDLAEKLKERVDYLLHLSTNMCTGHRRSVVDLVKRRLDDKLPICLIATQCVEAGVDIDFPVVYRAMAPLESIAQAAGRCNRSGSASRGQVHVFTLDDRDDSGGQRRAYPPGYDFAVQATQTYIAALRSKYGAQLPEIINSTSRLRDYYQMLYSLEGRNEEVVEDERALIDAIRAGDFITVDQEYRLIKQDMINILVPYETAKYESLLEEALETSDWTPKQTRRWIARARPHSVSVYRPQRSDAPILSSLLPIDFGLLEDERSDIASTEIDWWYPTQAANSYDALVGLNLAEPQWVM